MVERFDTLEAVRKRLALIAKELEDERLAGWKDGPQDFYIRRIQVFCELLYADMLARMNPEVAKAAERAVSGVNTPPSPERRNFVQELERLARD